MKYVVVSPDALKSLDKIKHEFKDSIIIITPLTLAYAIKNGVDPLEILKGVWVRAYSHKFQKIENLSEAQSEALLVAKEFEAELLASDSKVIEAANKVGVKCKVI